MVKGRSPRESNPLPGEKPGFVASHDTTGYEDYKRTSPLNPLPVKSIGDSNVKDVAVKAELELINKGVNDLITKDNSADFPLDYPDKNVKAELELIKQGIADNKATNDLILARLDNPIDTKLTGSKQEYVGYSTDTKPEGEKGDSFLELDGNKDIYIHDGNDWVVF